MSAAAKLPMSLARMTRMRDQGVRFDERTLTAIREAEAEALNVVVDGGARTVRTVEDDTEHAHDCGCAECAANAAAVGCDAANTTSGRATAPACS